MFPMSGGFATALLWKESPLSVTGNGQVPLRRHFEMFQIFLAKGKYLLVYYQL